MSPVFSLKSSVAGSYLGCHTTGYCFHSFSVLLSDSFSVLPGPGASEDCWSVLLCKSPLLGAWCSLVMGWGHTSRVPGAAMTYFSTLRFLSNKHLSGDTFNCTKHFLLNSQPLILASKRGLCTVTPAFKSVGFLSHFLPWSTGDLLVPSFPSHSLTGIFLKSHFFFPM